MPTKKQKTKAQKLAEELMAKRRQAFDLQPAIVARAAAFCEGYKEYLDKGKTERACAKKTVELLVEAGYKPYDAKTKYRPGAKVYLVNRDKSVTAATIGRRALEEGVRLSIAHMDAPRLDLKPNPLYENENISYLKTHYYGGIRKYQWVTIPLAMYGVVIRADGAQVEIAIGDEPGDPVFTITDLLPHLSAEQNKRSLSEGIKGEELNILLGGLPFEDEDASERVKLETMRLLNEKYGITERDFTRAEIEIVPAFPARDVGLDRAFVGAYGQDDRVCCYTALMAEVDTKSPEHTTVCVLTDKEETGSDGNTGLAGEYLFHFLEDLCAAQGAAYRDMLARSACFSADVNAAFDPSFPEPFEKRNASFAGEGVVVSKYGGARGKSSTSDASAELMGYVTNLLDKENIAWQIGEMGKVDAGGGGTIAKFVANKNVDVVDIGVPVLSMHSPFEVTSKLDVYHTYLAFKAFAQDGTMPTYGGAKTAKKPSRGRPRSGAQTDGQAAAKKLAGTAAAARPRKKPGPKPGAKRAGAKKTPQA